MNRREFIEHSLASIGIAGLAGLTASCSFRSVPVSVLGVNDLNKDHHRTFAEVLSNDDLIVRGKRVLLKPNFVEYHESRPINTDVRLIRQVTDACLRLGAKEVIVAEAAGHRRDPWYSVYNPALKEKLDARITCIDLNHCTAVRMRNKGPYTGLRYFYVAEPVAAADIVISMPKMKTHHWGGGYTLDEESLWNLAGHFLWLAQKFSTY